jgi:CubicO group peptidase (beta-lactamase class C family)
MWEYSRATDVLGALVEAVSGQTLGDFLTQHIFQPLKMHETGFSVPPENHHRLAEPFKHDPDGGIQLRLINIQVAPKFESGGGGLASTAHDYAQFLQLMLNKGELDGVRLLSSHSVDLMTADHLGNMPINSGASADLLPPGHGFGLGFAVRKDVGISAVLGSVGVYYWGGIAGTTFFVDPKLDMFAILMIQAPNQRDYYRPLFRNLVYAALEA